MENNIKRVICKKGITVPSSFFQFNYVYEKGKVYNVGLCHDYIIFVHCKLENKVFSYNENSLGYGFYYGDDDNWILKFSDYFTDYEVYERRLKLEKIKRLCL